jgi:UTP--glucose-1-phosphate uridylyltransferase
MAFKIKKAVIPVAGLGTRFLPATKTVPKEMLPIVDRPALLYIVEECARAGIEDVILVAGRNKAAIEDFFDTSYELEDTLSRQNKLDLLKSIQDVKNLVNIISIRQKQAMGLGHAIHTAAPITGDEPFAVLLGDELMISDGATPSAIGELCRLYEETHVSSVATMEVPAADVGKYGIIAADLIAPNRWKVRDVVEKPSVESAPSRLALPGRYVFSPRLMNELADTRPGKNGEIQLTDGMRALAKTEGLLATTVQADRYDTGDKLGFLIANIELALKRPELKTGLTGYLKKLAHTLSRGES